MAIEEVKAWLARYGLANRVIEFASSSATVELAAADLGCEPARIAKSMAFLIGEQPIIILMAGDARVDNARYKARFGKKAVMLRPEALPQAIGHPMGGVCPFAIRPGVPVYLDGSLRRFDTVYPAAGTAASAVRLSVGELQTAVGEPFAGWVDVTKGWREEEQGDPGA